MAATLAILQDITARVQSELPDIEARLFPDNPATYRFAHPTAAVLVGYQGSQFAKPHDIGAVVQQRVLTLHLTVFGRGVHTDQGALDVLDRLRLAVVGHKPVHCNPIHLLSEAFLSEAGGVWQYELRLQTETQQVQQCAPDTRPLLTTVHLYRDGATPPHQLNPKP